mmetsp:Transcript_42348/g.128460  ORF Transcript_42348/g.128460 Transcript_42348/m.128460 type:complete len:266 (-) Transcript_42348:80-877(-)
MGKSRMAPEIGSAIDVADGLLPFGDRTRSALRVRSAGTTMGRGYQSGALSGGRRSIQRMRGRPDVGGRGRRRGGSLLQVSGRGGHDSIVHTGPSRESPRDLPVLHGFHTSTSQASRISAASRSHVVSIVRRVVENLFVRGRRRRGGDQAERQRRDRTDQEEAHQTGEGERREPDRHGRAERGGDGGGVHGDRGNVPGRLSPPKKNTRTLRIFGGRRASFFRARAERGRRREEDVFFTAKGTADDGDVHTRASGFSESNGGLPSRF